MGSPVNFLGREHTERGLGRSVERDKSGQRIKASLWIMRLRGTLNRQSKRLYEVVSALHRLHKGKMTFVLSVSRAQWSQSPAPANHSLRVCARVMILRTFRRIVSTPLSWDCVVGMKPALPKAVRRREVVERSARDPRRGSDREREREKGERVTNGGRHVFMHGPFLTHAHPFSSSPSRTAWSSLLSLQASTMPRRGQPSERYH